MDSGSVNAMPPTSAPHATRSELASNRRFYDALWSASYVVSPQRFNTWPLLSALAASATARLEIGPGLHPRLPIAGTHFVDVSAPGPLASEGPRGSHDARRDHRPAVSRSQLRPGVRLRHRRARRGRPAGLSRARPDRAGRCDRHLLGAPGSRALERLRRRSSVTFDATIPTICWSSWASTPSCSSRARSSACSPGVAGSSTSPCGA